ncbi:unnamed protein product [Lepeophtheirus salmonis]|uniref:(salmon louse) hypothetical protein n=1 Tax=Lepeophtheirus salmonis TaxID=72036 RepID=A0A7R8CZX9_LEPSM|nr:unnamed protein product [Lepeophtheirus salmonis]CAF2979851.1 unnamed protein product [Lepeophtheirus salmonis]
MPRWILEDEDFQQSLQRRLTVNFDRVLSASRIALRLSNTIQVTTKKFIKRRKEASRKFNDNLDAILTQGSPFVRAYAADTINTFRIHDIVDEEKNRKIERECNFSLRLKKLGRKFGHPTTGFKLIMVDGKRLVKKRIS